MRLFCTQHGHNYCQNLAKSQGGAENKFNGAPNDPLGATRPAYVASFPALGGRLFRRAVMRIALRLEARPVFRSRVLRASSRFKRCGGPRATEASGKRRACRPTGLNVVLLPLERIRPVLESVSPEAEPQGSARVTIQLSTPPPQSKEKCIP